MNKKHPPPITGADSGRGMRRNRFGSKALKMVQNNEIMPYWDCFRGRTETRLALERWGLAVFRKIRAPVYNGQDVYYAKLTERGIQTRDAYAKMIAERKSKRLHGE